MLALGAALFGLISVGAWDSFFHDDSSATGVTLDPSRVASFVAAGIGFLGGGAILKQSGGVRGLTTASSLWVCAAVGLAAGLGMWVASVAATVAAFLSLAALRPARSMLRRGAQRRSGSITAILRSDANPSEVVRLLHDSRLVPVQVRTGRGHDGRMEVVAEYQVADSSALAESAAAIAERDEVAEVVVGAA
jgi:putative Mg2+ transporter-C (MgtC) family protein